MQSIDKPSIPSGTAFIFGSHKDKALKSQCDTCSIDSIIHAFYFQSQKLKMLMTKCIPLVSIMDLLYITCVSIVYLLCIYFLINNTYMNKNFVKVQVQARPEIAQKFQDAFEQSECNTKGDFLTKLLNYWLNPQIDQDNIKKIQELESILERKGIEYLSRLDELEELIEEQSNAQDALSESKETLAMSNEELQNELNHYRRHLSPLLVKYLGQEVRPRHPITKRRIRRVIHSEKDVMDVIMNSIKIV